MGRFYGCKLDLAMNQFGEIVSTELSNGHVADIKMLTEITKNLKSKVYDDRGYINLKLKEDLKQKGIDLVTYHHKNMELIQLHEFNHYYLRQRKKIESFSVY